MLVVTFISLIAIILTYLESRHIIKNGMMIGFIMITALLCIHYDYGNDYMSYYSIYNEIDSTPFSWNNLSNSMFHQDSGWVLLNYIFKPFGGFFVLIFFLSIVQNVIIYKFIKHEVVSSYQVFSVFLYVMTTSFYLMSFSMLRQWFVVCVFLGCWSKIKERKWIFTLLVLYLCTFIHESAKLLLPFAFWGFMPVKNGKVVCIFLLVFFVVLLTANNLINDIFSFFQDSGKFDLYFDRYGDVSNELSIGLGFVLQLLPLLVTFWYLMNNFGSIDNKSLVLISSIGFIVMIFASVIPMAGRLASYFSIFRIASIPLMYSMIQNRVIKYSLIVVLILITTYDYIIFFNNPVWIDKYSAFKTIFSVL